MTTLFLYPAGKTDTSYAVPDSVTSIEDGAFYDNAALESLTFPDTVTSVGASAFGIVFYDTDGVTVLEPTAANLAGSTFKLTDGIWVKQIVTESDTAVVYVVFAIFVFGMLLGLAVLSRRRT